MKTKGILFKGEMIRALLNTKIGSYPAEPIDVSKPHKGQTRRLIDPQPDFTPELETYSPSFVDKKTGEIYPGKEVFGFASEDRGWPCPYPPGTILYAKETFSADGAFGVDGRKVYRADIAGGKHPSGLKWKPSIFMPKSAARIWLKVVGVLIERVNEISHGDARLEGVGLNQCQPLHASGRCGQGFSADWVGGYKALWDSINGAGSFNKGERVWAYSFKRINKPEGV